MAYHNGSIWPHDNALIAAGVAQFADKELALRIFTAQLEASTYFDGSRLPELFCGFRRREGKPPTRLSGRLLAAGMVRGRGVHDAGGLSGSHDRRARFAGHVPSSAAAAGARHVDDPRSHRGRGERRSHAASLFGTVGLNVERRKGRLDVVMLS